MNNLLYALSCLLAVATECAPSAIPRIFAFALLVPTLGCGGRFEGLFGDGVRLGAIDDPKLNEVSGAAASRRFPGILWMHNDGSKERVFAVATNGRVRAKFDFDVKVQDLEDIAVGPGAEPGSSFVYLGDIGDNEQKRKSIRIIRFREPNIESASTGAQGPDIDDCEFVKARYPGGPCDAEALLVDPLNGDVLVVTKEKWRARVFRLEATSWDDDGTVDLEEVGEIGFAHVSGGNVSGDGTGILLRSETGARVWRRRSGETLAAAMHRRGESAPVVGPPREPNGESIAFRYKANGYYTVGEGKSQAIFYFAIPSR